MYTGCVLKLLIICCTLVWLVGLFMGRKRPIKNSGHLMQLFLWLVMVFLVAAWLPQLAFFEDRLAARAVTLVAWIVVANVLSRRLARLFDKG